MAARSSPAWSSAPRTWSTYALKSTGAESRAWQDGSSASEKVTTRQRRASASTPGRIHSQRPWMPGITASGGPDPRSTMSIPNQFRNGLPVFNVC